MRTIINEWRKCPRALATQVIAFLLDAVYIAINAWFMVLLTHALDDIANLKSRVATIVIVSLIQTMLTYCKTIVRENSYIMMQMNLQKRYNAKILDADYNLFTKYSCAGIRTASEFQSAIIGGMKSINTVILNLIRVGATLWSMLTLSSPTLLVPIAVVYAFFGFILEKVFIYYGKMWSKVAELFKRSHQEYDNIIDGFAELRTFGMEEHHRKVLFDLNEQKESSKFKRTKINAGLGVLFEVTDTIGMLAVFVYVASAIKTGEVTAVTGMSLIMLVFRLSQPLDVVLQFVNNFTELLKHEKDYLAVINYENVAHDDGHLEMSEFSKEISFEDVSFSYDTDTGSVLDHVSFTIPKGAHIGICGKSGGGKTTILKLLNRFYDVTSGKIKIDGIDINDIKVSSYRKFVRSVHQDTHVFPGTIRDNVMYGNANCTEAEVIDACKKANLYDFIMEQPEKFNTQVGPRGLTLSGGQKQRIALARLFLSNPKIVILDEATSALDNESEWLIQDAIEKFGPETTVITVAHRLSTIEKSDMIYVVGDHHILEGGTHDELMLRKGAYYDMQQAARRIK